jgi:RimJ/RimL family protein N-acetyltransferase
MKDKIYLVTPTLEEMIFRKELLADPTTMSYNAKWGGAIDFSEDRWERWYNEWCRENINNRFYRFVYSENEQQYVGEVAYHYDDEYMCYICDVIIKAVFRGRGYGKNALSLLLKEAAKNGITEIYDNIAADNSSIVLFQKAGFTEEWHNDDFIMLRKDLEN